MGSIRDALRAGKYAASAAAIKIVDVAIAVAIGSADVSPNNLLAINRPSASALVKPIAIPIATIVSDSDRKSVV